ARLRERGRRRGNVARTSGAAQRDALDRAPPAPSARAGREAQRVADARYRPPALRAPPDARPGTHRAASPDARAGVLTASADRRRRRRDDSRTRPRAAVPPRGPGPAHRAHPLALFALTRLARNRMDLERSRYVVVEGPIGAGKTSLARVLAQRAGGEELFERPEDNPFLER